MTSKGAKETIVSKLGFKSSSSSSKVEAELDRVKKENAHLKKKIEDLAKRHIRPPDSDKSKLLERILSLETLRERNNQQLLVKEQELETLRQQLTARGGEVVASLQAQLEQRRREAEQRDALFQSVSQETENLKNKLASVSARCQSLETQLANGQQAPPPEVALVQDQLKDALEKNQQWLMYDQQREAYVQSVLAHTRELEQQLAQAKQQQATPEPASEGYKLFGECFGSRTTTERVFRECTLQAGQAKDDDQKKHLEQMLAVAQKDLETQKNELSRTQLELQLQKEQNSKAQAEVESQKLQVSRLQSQIAALQSSYEIKCTEMSSLQRKYEVKSRELGEAREELQGERLRNRYTVNEERKVSSEMTDRMRIELETTDMRLEEERKRSAELLLQVNMLQKSLLSQKEEQMRIATLEQQIQLSAKEFENEKIDRQSMQHQLQKVLKELRKARDQIAKLESAKTCNARFSEPSSYNRFEFERLTIDDPIGPTSPSKVPCLLDESFLECPKCHAPYPTSRHRELLAHIDYCMA
ncbi:centrosomal protein of 55 kDa isoform X2 [Boleophthalmus pectinirostris]|uniref:centrosomal protein of 55 kDa isoform X2 n=1 Tax=Boleophthalmus pectinirostris TaxID=150288 RepID=UPI00242D9D3D|nr:centrosomal protein of 55 kDa isoform X2 [Boleophthalmus pectinirostris]